MSLSIPSLSSAAVIALAALSLAPPAEAHGNHHAPVHHNAKHHHPVHWSHRNKAYARGYRRGYRRAIRSIARRPISVYRPSIRPVRTVVVAPHRSWLTMGFGFPL
ncbi:MAG: hypothetical protein VKI93_03055 [Synechococcus sp.]|nr:hypothetical protein [Synechococcus sp.]